MVPDIKQLILPAPPLGCNLLPIQFRLPLKHIIPQNSLNILLVLFHHLDSLQDLLVGVVAMGEFLDVAVLAREYGHVCFEGLVFLG